MNIYRIHRDFQLFGFQDSIGGSPVLQTTLSKYQETIVSQKKLNLKDVISENELEKNELPALIFHANCLFTSQFLNAAMNYVKATDGKQNLQFGLVLNENTLRFSLPTEKHSSTRKLSFFYKANNDVHFQYVELTGQEFEMKIPMPKQIVPPGFYSLSQSEVFAADIISPFHLLQANMGLNMNRIIPTQRRIPKSLREKWTKPNNFFAVLGLKLLNRKGKNCNIHPSAVVEGCILGDNVIVGANAVLRLSIIGSDTHISDSAVVTYSVIGERNYVSALNQLSFCLTYEDVFTIHGPYQFSVFGRSTAVFATINCDIRLDEKTISIETSNGVLDSEQHLLGIAYGHGSKVGASNIIASGRLVPNKTILNPPDFIHLKFPPSG
jgi:hypothetical protein